MITRCKLSISLTLDRIACACLFLFHFVGSNVAVFQQWGRGEVVVDVFGWQHCLGYDLR